MLERGEADFTTTISRSGDRDRYLAWSDGYRATISSGGGLVSFCGRVFFECKCKGQRVAIRSIRRSGTGTRHRCLIDHMFKESEKNDLRVVFFIDRNNYLQSKDVNLSLIPTSAISFDRDTNVVAQ